jgi:hypothetical protein
MDFSTSGSHSQRRGGGNGNANANSRRRPEPNDATAEISSQRYLRMIQQEIQQRNAARARRIQLLERALSQQTHVTNTVLRLLEAEIQQDRATQYGASLPYVDNAAPWTLPPRRVAGPTQPLPQPQRQQSRWTPLFQMATTTAATDGFSTADIEEATQLVPYDNSMNETRCPITWTNFTVGQNVLQIRRCGHVFDPEALRTWFRQNRRCPICRIHPFPAAAAASPATAASTAPTTISRIVEEVAESLVHSISDVLDPVDRASNTDRSGEGADEGSGPFNISSFEYTVDITDLLSALRGTRTP